MIRTVFCALLILISAPLNAYAQNCENIKSGLGVNQKPQNASRDIVGKSLDEIMDRGWIQFAVYEDFAPYSFLKDGKLTGIDIDLGNMIAKFIGVEAKFYGTGAGENVDTDLRNNVIKGPLIGGKVSNVMLHVPYNRQLACRNEQVVMNGQYFNEKIAIAYDKAKYPDGGPTPAFFRFDTVGVENDSLADFYLSSIRGGILIPKMTRYKNTGAAMDDLKKGKINAVMGPLGQLEYGLDEKTTVHSPPLPGLALGVWTLGVAVRHNWRPLSYSVDDAIRAGVEDGTIKGIFAKYGLSYTPPKW